MNSLKRAAVLAVVLALAVAGQVQAARVGTAVTDHINSASGGGTGVVTWTKAGSPYYLTKPIYVHDGGTLVVEAGVVVMTYMADDGGIVVTRDGQIFVEGTEAEPVIMTSAQDVATWTGTVADADPLADEEVTEISTVGDPKTGTWRMSANEWRNLTILGKGVISASWFDADGDDKPGAPAPVGPATDGDPYNPGPTQGYTAADDYVDGTAQKQMEGLASGEGITDDDTRYGGNDDDHDAGCLRYVSFRYTGRVLGEGDELNGLSMGAIGRETEVEHVDIMNNVDDGIETWGGTVCYKYVNIWNIGDDSFDCDQGWRGKAQFGLIVQGYCLDAKQGSGSADNCIEHDGAEQSDVQPRTTSTIYNFTCIGEPNTGDDGTAWRDNARIQYRKCIWIDCGEKLVQWDDTDGDGGRGYGFDGDLDGPGGAGAPHAPTHTWAEAWTTDWDVLPTINAGAGDFAPSELYWVQTSGKLCEIVDSVWYNIGSGLGDAPVDLTDAVYDNQEDTVLPIAHLVRETPGFINVTGLFQRVIELDPRANSDAAKTAARYDPCDVVCGFFANTPYRGAMSKDVNWAEGWTAADAFGFFTSDTTVADPDHEVVMSPAMFFDTVEGVVYTVESSEDMKTWTPICTVVGTGERMSVADAIENLDQEAKFYRVIAQ
ncbi:MAG: hypothetical protein R6X20_15930 [Phycisphaerae bacterium]